MIYKKLNMTSLFILLCLFYLFFDGYFSYVLLFVMPLVILYLWLTIKLLSKKITADLIGPKKVVKNNHAEFFIVIENKSIFSIVNGEVIIEFDNDSTGNRERQEISFQATRKGISKIPLAIEGNRSGNFQIRVLAVKVSDILKLFQANISSEQCFAFSVYPKGFAMEMQVSEQHARQIEGQKLLDENGDVELLHVKPYLPGDSIKRIHWKLSSKLDEVVVKEFADSGEEELVIWLDSSYWHASEDHVLKIDACIEVLFTVALQIMQMNRTSKICYYESNNQMIYEARIEQYDQLVQELNRIFTLKWQKRRLSHVERNFLQQQSKPILVSINEQIQSVNDQAAILLCESEKNSKERPSIPGTYIYSINNVEQILARVTV